MPRKFFVFMALALTVPLAACDGGAGVQSPGTFTLLLTDDPAFDEAWVTIESIDLVGSDGGGIVNLLPGDADGAWEPPTVNLLELQNEVLTLVEDHPVAGGFVTQLRFVMSGGCVVMGLAEDGTRTDETEVYASDGYEVCGDATGRLQMPSYGQSGLKVQLPGGGVEVDGNRTIVLLDFLVGDSFGHIAGRSGLWAMHPHIVATEIGFSGTVLVELTADDGALDDVEGASLGDFQARLELDGATDGAVPFTDGDDDGVFTAFFEWLVPGDYTVYLELPEQVEGEGQPYQFTTTDDVLQIDVTIGESDDAMESFNVTCAYPNEGVAECGDTGGGD
jgi:hypothetical protein